MEFFMVLGGLHERLRLAQLPGWKLTYDDGSDRWSAEVYSHSGEGFHIRDRSPAVFLESLDEALTEAGA